MNPIKVMVNGMPGNVACVIATHIISDTRFELTPYSLTGPEIEESEIVVKNQRIGLIKPDVRDVEILRVKNEAEFFLSADYTHPSAVNANTRFYCRNELPFVMGTTGGDRRQLEEIVRTSSIAAVIAPNMAKQIVAFQAMMEYAAENFPGLFKNYSLEVKESHQEGKADTSGTAKAVVNYFNQLGIPFGEENIIKERDPRRQKDLWGIPEQYLTGHGWHTYTLVSEDNTVRFEFTHNINGREIYAKGTLDALSFLDQKMRTGPKGRVYSMIDVLKGA